MSNPSDLQPARPGVDASPPAARAQRAVTALLCASLIAGLASGCRGAAERVRQHTYPPDFRYLSTDEVRSSMWQLAAQMRELEDALGDERRTASARQRMSEEILARIEGSIERLPLEGQASNHPLLQRHGPELLERVRRARRDVALEPPRFFAASSLSGTCSTCHASTAR